MAMPGGVLARWVGCARVYNETVARFSDLRLQGKDCVGPRLVRVKQSLFGNLYRYASTTQAVDISLEEVRAVVEACTESAIASGPDAPNTGEWPARNRDMSVGH